MFVFGVRNGYHFLWQKITYEGPHLYLAIFGTFPIFTTFSNGIISKLLSGVRPHKTVDLFQNYKNVKKKLLNDFPFMVSRTIAKIVDSCRSLEQSYFIHFRGIFFKYLYFASLDRPGFYLFYIYSVPEPARSYQFFYFFR